MTLRGQWRIVELADHDPDYADMMGPAHIALGAVGGEFAFGCVTGSFSGVAHTDAVTFDWQGNDEMDEAHGDGWAERRPDGSLIGEIRFHGGDEIPFIARPWDTSSTAC